MFRNGWRIETAMILWGTVACLYVMAIAGDSAGGGHVPRALAADANLNDVFFLDPRIGWAVGDRGVIWQTADGGETWTLRPFPTSQRLTAVWFRDTRNGWIGTSWTQPYLHVSRGQIWRTEDGGESWQPSRTDTLPGVQKLFVSDTGLISAATASSLLHGSDLFRSRDGRSWQPPGGRVARVDARETRGDESRADFGHEEIPSAVSRGFDWLTIARQGDNVWFAGDPGTVVVHWSGRAQEWSVNSTGQQLPIRKLRFVDARHGWAVGAQGTILSTSDGGASWQVQRMIADRVPVLGVYAEASDIDWELLAQLSIQEGYRSHVIVLDQTECAGFACPVCASDKVDAISRAGWGDVTDTFLSVELSSRESDDARHGAAGIDERADEAAVESGGSGVTYRRSCDGDDETRTHRLVRALRTWRPDVVVTAGDSGDARRLHAEIVVAIEKAAESTTDATQRPLNGLEPWKVRKAFAREPAPAARGTARSSGPVVAAAQLVLPLGQTLADVGASCRAHIDSTYHPSASKVRYRTLLPGGNGRQIMSGVVSARGSQSRRLALDTLAGRIRGISVLAQRRRMIELLLTRHVAAGTDTEVLLGQLDELLPNIGLSGAEDTPVHAAAQAAAGEIVFRISELLDASDRCADARAVREYFLQRFSKHPLTDAVVWRQLRASTSAELQLWQTRLPQKTTQAVPATFGADRVTRSASVDLARKAADRGKSPGRPTPTNNSGKGASRNAEFDQMLRAASPLLASRPEVVWALAEATGKNVGQRIARQESIDSQWRRRGAAAAWLDSRRGPIPPFLWKCVRRPAPHLDGKLDDDTWQDVPSISLYALGSDGPDATGGLKAACDAHFLYLAISCKKVAAVTYPPSQGIRRRDSDLSSFDHIALSIDTNRDAMSAWQLSIDSRGWANDACVSHVSWNPRWHIGSAASADNWSVEAAIPLKELTAETTTSGTAWAVAVRRYVPAHRPQAWPPTANGEPTPQSFGLLVFE